MRRIATLSSSLLLALAGLAAAQQRAPVNHQELLRALAAAGDDAAAREKALRSMDEQPMVSLSTFRLLAQREGPTAREAVRRWLPHPACASLAQGTIGEARRRELELLGPDAKREPGGFARAVQGLLERDDAPTRTTALRLLKIVPAPLPEKLLPFLSHKDPAVARAAAEALRGVARPEMKPEILKAFRASDPSLDPVLAPLVAGAAGPGDVPELLGILKADPRRERAILDVVRTAGDAAAEPALLELLEGLGNRNPQLLLDALSLLGTSASLAPLRKYRDGLPQEDARREACRQALLALRDPALAREILAGPVEFRTASGELARLGDRGIVPDLAARLRGKLKVEERNRLLELLGLMGGPGEVDLIAGWLEDARHADSAAIALLYIGDSRAAAPLARALRMAEARSTVARALLYLPPSFEGAEEPLLEILDDPDGHSSFDDALRVAARVRSPRLKEKVLSIVADSRSGFSSRVWTSAWAILPMLGPQDREPLLKAKSAAKAPSNLLLLLALAATGDEDSLKSLLDQASKQRLSLRHPLEPGRLLELPGMAPAVEEAFKASPGWLEGAEWLAHHDSASGAELLRQQIHRQGGREFTQSARALLRLRDPAGVEAYVSAYESGAGPPDPRAEEEEAATMLVLLDEAALARLRELVALPFPNPAAVRLLALRGDPALETLLRSGLRPSPAGMAYASLEEPAALPLARTGAKSLAPDFLRMLRASNPRRRILGARCLAALGDRAAIHALVPLLDDLQAEIPTFRRSEPVPPAPRVSDAAADAIEKLAGRPFEKAPGRRAQALKDWYARERESLK